MGTKGVYEGLGRLWMTGIERDWGRRWPGGACVCRNEATRRSIGGVGQDTQGRRQTKTGSPSRTSVEINWRCRASIVGVGPPGVASALVVGGGFWCLFGDGDPLSTHAARSGTLCTDCIYRPSGLVLTDWGEIGTRNPKFDLMVDGTISESQRRDRVRNPS